MPWSIFNFLEDLEYLAQGRLMKLFTTALQGFAEFDGGVLHMVMRVGGTADEKKMLTSSQALMPVLIVQPDAEKSHDATIILILLIRHLVAPASA